MLKQNDIIEYTAEHYSNAETVGTVDGYTVFVPQMIVDEQAKVKVNYVKRNVAYGDVLQLENVSPLRINPI
ncbi:MAG: TRAM domain-containing protein, partial [Clostridia bacterium]|nr:TRAM domain-containing protein [Clostridia bacterium]